MTEQHIYDAIYILGSLGFLGLIIALVHAWLEDKHASRDDHGGQHTRRGPARWDRDILDDLRDRFHAARNVPGPLPLSPPAALASPTPLAGGPGTLNVTVPAPPDHGTVTLQGAVRAENAVAAALLPDRALETHHHVNDGAWLRAAHGATLAGTTSPVHEYAGRAWQVAGQNEAARNWTPRDTYTDTGWTKRSALDLEIRLAREQLDRFDHILPYATSGMAPRWSAA